MIDNMSGIFGSNVMGGRDKTEEELIEEQRRELMKQDATLEALNPINFEEKVMGGEKSKMFLHGKLKPLDDTFTYTDRVNQLTGKGQTTSEIDNILAEGKKTLTSYDITGITKTTQRDINELIGTTKQKIKQKKPDVKKDSSGIRAFEGINFQQKMQDVFKMKPINPFQNQKNVKVDSYFNMKNPFQNTKQQKQETLNKINQSFGVFTHTPIRKSRQTIQLSNNIALNKINQSIGLTQQKGPKDHDINRLIYGYNTGNYIRQTSHAHKEHALNKIQNSFGVLNNAVGSQQINNILQGMENPELTARRRIQQQHGPNNLINHRTNNVVNNILGNHTPKQDVWSRNYQRTIDQYTGRQLTPTTARQVEVLPPEEIPSTEADTYIQPETHGNFSHTGGTGWENVGENEEVEEIYKDTKKEEMPEDINSKIEWLMKKIEDPNTPSKQRGSYIKLYHELIKTQRGDKKTDFDRERWEHERLRTEDLTKQKKILGEKEIDVRKDLSEKELEYRRERDSLTDEKDKKRLDQQFALDKAKLKAQEQKGDIALWESKLKSGQNMLGTLLGGSGQKTDFHSLVSTGRAHTTPESAATSYNISMMAGGGQPSPGYQSKVQDSVGVGEGKTYSQKVFESVGNKQAEELIREEAQRQQEIEQTPQYQPQPVQPQQYQPQPVQPQQYEPQYQPQQPQIDWNELTPEQAARYDPEYANYKLQSQDKVTYRRGPYKTN